MPAPRKYLPELRDRAIRLVTEAREQEPKLSLNAAAKRIGPRVGITAPALLWNVLFDGFGVQIP
jgi:transposase